MLSGTYLLFIVSSAVAALAGGTARAARARFRSPLRWAALSVACSVIAAVGGSRGCAMLLAHQDSPGIGVVFWPIGGAVLGAAIPLLVITRLRRIEPPAASGRSWRVFVTSGLSLGDRAAELTIDGGSMQIIGAHQKFVIPLVEIGRVFADVATVIVERAAPQPAIQLCPALDDQAGPDTLRLAALRLHKRLAAEIARCRVPSG
ncbi:MAG TPA: hypothetical protein VFH68_06990 [Polyangia bacterium]|nr:hypothetical protein [Polyangia bacterium]